MFSLKLKCVRVIDFDGGQSAELKPVESEAEGFALIDEKTAPDARVALHWIHADKPLEVGKTYSFELSEVSE